MKGITGKPHTLKEVNLSLVRKLIKERGSATRGEIVEATKISVTTVRTLLTELLKHQEIVEAGYDESIGGRKAVRYALKKDRFYGVALCLGGEHIRYLTVNICGEIQERGEFPIHGDLSESVCALLDGIFEQLEVKSIGVGVPGIVDVTGYLRKNEAGILVHTPIGELLRQRYRVPVLLENDLNAITLGFGRCYLSEFPEERCEDVNMAYLHFEPGCVSAGFLSGGRVLRGWKNFVGELGLFPVGEGRTLDDLLDGPLDDRQYAEVVAKLAAAVCCVLNPQYIALGGDGFRADCLSLIVECFDGTLPDEMSAEIVYAEDKWHDYFGGMAHLTAEKIFSEVLLVQEGI